MSPKLKPEVHAITLWLHRNWDPIGCGVPEDEYESYSLPLYSMLVHEATAEEIAARLSEFQDGMGLPKPPTELVDVAQKLIADFPPPSR